MRTKYSGRWLIMAVLFSVVNLTMSGVAATETIKLGVAGPHSGGIASVGISALRGSQYVVEQVNSSGGVLGKMVEVLAEDDRCDPALATIAATNLVSAGVKVVMGHVCSGATEAALNIYKVNNVIAVSPSATDPSLTQSGEYPNFFRTVAPDDNQARVQVDFTADFLKVRNVAVLHDSTSYGMILANLAEQFIAEKQNLTLVLYEGLPPGQIDYFEVIQRIKQSGAEVVIFEGYVSRAAELVTQMREQNADAIFLSCDAAKQSEFIETAGEFAEGVYVTAPRDVSENPMAVEATAYYQNTYGEDPEVFYLEACAATLALLNAIERAGSMEYEALIQTLQNEWVETTLGRIKFDEHGDAIGVGHSVYQVENGAYVLVPWFELTQIANSLEFIADSVDDGTLQGSGPGRSAQGRLKALRNMIEAAGDLIEAGDYEAACQQLRDAYNRCDGLPRPPDIVEGEAREGLADMILDLMAGLGC